MGKGLLLISVAITLIVVASATHVCAEIEYEGCSWRLEEMTNLFAGDTRYIHIPCSFGEYVTGRVDVIPFYSGLRGYVQVSVVDPDGKEIYSCKTSSSCTISFDAFKEGEYTLIIRNFMGGEIDVDIYLCKGVSPKIVAAVFALLIGVPLAAMAIIKYKAKKSQLQRFTQKPVDVGRG